MSAEQVAKGVAFDANKVPNNVKIDYSGRKYSFAGWTAKDLSSANPSTATGELYSGLVASDMTAYAVYRQEESSSDEKFTVTYKVYDDGWIDMSSEQVAKGGNFDDTKAPSNAKIDYSGRKYSFAGWTNADLSSKNPSTATGTLYSGTVVADMTVYAVYQVHPQVTYKYWNGTEWVQLGEVQTVEPNSGFDDSKKPVFVVKFKMKSTVPDHTDESYDYAFQFNNAWTNTGWTSAEEATKTVNDTVSATALSASDKVTGDMIVYAMYKPIKDFVYVDKGWAKIYGSSNKLSMDHNFLICDHEVTQAEFNRYDSSHIAYFSSAGGGSISGSTDNLPVERVCWYDAEEYCNWLSDKEGLIPYYTVDKINPDLGNNNLSDSKKWLVTINENANGYRLPFEHEWEYAARGGVNGSGNKYSGSDNVEDVVWYNFNSENRTHEVRTKVSNELGLYDMSGNVFEWCWDWFGDSGMAPPVGPTSGSFRVIRGCCHSSSADFCVISHRAYSNMNAGSSFNIGFRVARSCP